MKKVKGFFSFYSLAFTQVAVSTALIAYMELTLNRLGYTATGSWEFYVFHLLFLLPCVLLLTPAGFFSDKYPKEKVLFWTTLLSLPAVGLFCAGAYLSNIVMLFAGLALFFVLQAFQSPAKNGYMKELMGVRYLVQGSGILMVVTFSAMMLAGVAIAFAVREGPVLPILYTLGGLQFVGFLFSLRLPSIGAYDEELKFPWNRYWNFLFMRRKVAKAWKNRALRQSIIGLSMFWTMIFLMVFVIQDQFGSGSLFNQDALANYAIFGTAVGLVAGFVFAMKMSRDFIEMGLIPMGTAGASILIFLIPLIDRPYNAIAFTLLGFCGGIYMLPMFAMLLYNTKPRSAGHVLSLSNMFQNLCILVFEILAVMALHYFEIDRMNVFFMLGIVCLAGTVWALWAMPQTLLRQLLRSVLSVHYRFLVSGVQNIPWEGPVLLVGNHISYIDWAIIQMASPRPMRFVITRRPFEKWYVRLLLSQMETIDLDISNPGPAMEEARQALLRGEAVVMFPENAMTATGNMNRFRLDYSAAIKDVPRVKLLPFYVHGLWGSVYSMAEEGFREQIHSQGRVISVAFGAELPLDSNPTMVKRAVQELSITAWTSYTRKLRPVASAWIRTVKRIGSGPSVFSPDGNHLSANALATASLTFGAIIDKLTKGEQQVGVLIPPSGPGIIVNMACLIRGKTVYNLNYTNTPDTMDYCCNVADVKTIITAHAFVDKLKQKGVPMDVLLNKYKVYYMEDLKEKIHKSTLVKNFLRVLLLPAWYLELRFFKKVSLNDVATIIFSSGSEGRPKGVELTHRNLLINIKQCESVLLPSSRDVFLGSLPLFHAFGFSITTMLCLVEGVPVATCPDPTDARLVSRLCAQFKVTIMVATGTFLRMWGINRAVHPLMFSHVRAIYAGAEKIREDVRQLYRTKFKLEIFEGFGCTETTPVAAVNTKDVLMDDYKTVLVGNKPGSVGAPLPGTQFRIVDPDTMEELPIGEDGLILIGGAQIMKGYLKDPERTAQAIAVINGKRWYKTGDKGHVDEDGYLTIVDRYSRFAKLGGEMVSLGSVDFKISECPLFDEIDHFAVAVPDGAKGEKIVLVYAGEKSEDEVKDLLRQVGLPPLMLPGAVVKVDVLPKLGSGKSDVQTGKKIAMERLGISA
jgi:acyl-[acyl-carrier-protein]-phospholipid O-acyltransferase/long-chain-fatty-acid--[acyl-carrier-protein] ligase